jgi:hypothetical protein
VALWFGFDENENDRKAGRCLLASEEITLAVRGVVGNV